MPTSGTFAPSHLAPTIVLLKVFINSATVAVTSVLISPDLSNSSLSMLTLLNPNGFGTFHFNFPTLHPSEISAIPFTEASLNLVCCLIWNWHPPVG